MEALTIDLSIDTARHCESSADEIAKTPTLQSDFYVFSLLEHKDMVTLDSKGLDKSEFYVSTLTNNNYKRRESSININSLQKLVATILYYRTGQTIIENREASDGQKNPKNSLQQAGLPAIILAGAE